MFGSANRRKLIKKGFACPKTRRKSTPKEWMRKLESNPWMKAGIFGVFVLVLALLIFSGEHPDPAKYFLIGLLVFLTAVAQLWICLLYTSPSPRDLSTSRMPSSA